MFPAQPPFPTAKNLPFQPSDGSQSSISICESLDGVSTAETRQWAGTVAVAATFSAAPIEVLGSGRVLSASQGDCWAIAAKITNAKLIIKASPWEFGAGGDWGQTPNYSLGLMAQ